MYITRTCYPDEKPTDPCIIAGIVVKDANFYAANERHQTFFNIPRPSDVFLQCAHNMNTSIQ